jgi:hypothetical protein
MTSKMDIENGMHARFLLVAASKLAQDFFGGSHSAYC